MIRRCASCGALVKAGDGPCGRCGAYAAGHAHARGGASSSLRGSLVVGRPSEEPESRRPLAEPAVLSTEFRAPTGIVRARWALSLRTQHTGRVQSITSASRRRGDSLTRTRVAAISLFLVWAGMMLAVSIAFKLVRGLFRSLRPRGGDGKSFFGEALRSTAGDRKRSSVDRFLVGIGAMTIMSELARRAGGSMTLWHVDDGKKGFVARLPQGARGVEHVTVGDDITVWGPRRRDGDVAARRARASRVGLTLRLAAPSEVALIVAAALVLIIIGLSTYAH